MAKLVEILARELKEWPKGNDFAYSSGHLARFATDAGGTTSDFIDIGLEPDDGRKAFVTRAEWRAAVDALKPDAQRFAEDYVEANKDRHAKEWNGEGLPPVGTVCDLVYQGCEQGHVEVLFCSRQTTVCLNLEDGREQFGETFDYEFRPVRTPEQIAAEERQNDIVEMARSMMIGLVVAGDPDFKRAEKLYDAGYRKQGPK